MTVALPTRFMSQLTQVRPTEARIDLGALGHNAREARRILDAAAGDRPAPEILAVVKANGYGHGAVHVARALEAVAEEVGIAWLGVALVEEGVELRRAGLRLPILVLGGSYEGTGYRELLDHDLTPVVFRLDHLEGLREAAGEGAPPIDVHLKVDTGMGRLGVLTDELPAFLEAAAEVDGIRIDGLLSHFANADLADDRETKAQVERFAAASAQVKAAGHAPTWVHLANSAAVLSRLGALGGHTLVRPGLMLYGYPPSEAVARSADLRPVLTWATRIVHLKRVPPGFKVSYGQTWSAPRESLVATLPVGYADGYDRRHSGGAPVLVGGRRCEIIGRVCMDMCMVDVTDVPDVALGDEVVLVGAQGEAEVGADELAERIGTIPYEVLCAIGDRVPRLPDPGL